MYSYIFFNRLQTRLQKEKYKQDSQIRADIFSIFSFNFETNTNRYRAIRMLKTCVYIHNCENKI